MAKINLRYHPSPSPTRVVDFPRLDGGLNLWELDYRLGRNESQEVQNLWWQDGVLQCRDGQEFISPEMSGKGYTCTQELFWDCAFFHIGMKIYYADLINYDAEVGITLTELCGGIPENRGTFFRYDDWLFYKNVGCFLKIAYHPTGTKFTSSSIVEDAYTPVILLNASPFTGSGDMYQPENRLSATKTVRYNAAETSENIVKAADGSTKTFNLGKTAAADKLTKVAQVYVGNTLAPNTFYTVDVSAGTVTFTSAPPADSSVTFVCKFGVIVYQLPVKDIDSVIEVKVDGVVKTVTTDYTVDLSKGTVVFKVAPAVTEPMTNNTVEITYSKANPDAMKSIMDCRYATVFGGSQNVCIVLGGCPAQPNAYFWNGNDNVNMNAAYWPMSFYNLAGDTEDAITGFGKQYGNLVVFKERSLGKSSYGVENVDDRNSISLTYTPINSKIGCDLPWTIQLIDNNLVFCNTYAGVHVVRDSSSALENNVVCISRNVNGTESRAGLLEDVRSVDRDTVCSLDDDNRYWVCANGHVYMWDYLVSEWKKPSWFYHTNINGVAYIRSFNKTYHMNSDGRVTLFYRSFMDYDGAIEKIYHFPPQFFDTYDRLKDIMYCIFATRSDTDSEVTIRYESDYETRYDKTNLRSMSWKLIPRNLTYRFLEVQKYAHVDKRRPGSRHVRHFGMRLSNNIRAQDLAIISAQIYYRFTGKER